MLKVIIELHPFGVEEEARAIETWYIANMGGNRYEAKYHAWFDTDPRVQPRPDPHVIIRRFDRARGAAALLAEVIKRFERAKNSLAEAQKLLPQGDKPSGA